MIVNETGDRIRNVAISIHGIISPRHNGRFSLELPSNINNITNQHVKLTGRARNKWRIKKIKFISASKSLTVTLQGVSDIRGRLYTKDPNKATLAEGVKVFLEGANSQTTTQKDGRFRLKIPNGFIINAQSKLQLNGRSIPGNLLQLKDNNTLLEIRADHRLWMGNDSVQVIVKNEQGQNLPNVSVLWQEKSFRSSPQGRFTIKSYDPQPQDTFSIPNYELVASNTNNQVITLIARKLALEQDELVKPANNPSNENNPVNRNDAGKELEQDFDKIASDLEEDRRQQIERSTRIKRDLSSLVDRLLGETDMSDKQRKNLEGYFWRLEQTFEENDSISSKLRQESRAQIYELGSIILEKDSLRSVAERRLKEVESEKAQIEDEKRLAEIQFRNNILILSGVILVLMAIAATFYWYNRVIKKQKNELIITKDALSEKVEEINIQNEEITSQRDSIHLKNKELEKAYYQITASINSARRIQHAILDDIQEIKSNFRRHFENGFVLYIPRDIVSGDFYWYSQRGPEIIIAAVDCTGHGVPGAFMTMLGNSLLDQIVNGDNITSPNEILRIMDERVQEILHQQERETSRDGMDMAILNINKYSGQAVFAGAKNHLFYVHADAEDKEIKYIKGTNLPIGSISYKKKKGFESHIIPLKGDEVFYLQSDGYQDQFGGQEERKRKYSKKRYKDFLLSICHYPMDEQLKLIREEFYGWKGETSQTDDVLVIGIQS